MDEEFVCSGEQLLQVIDAAKFGYHALAKVRSETIYETYMRLYKPISRDQYVISHDIMMALGDILYMRSLLIVEGLINLIWDDENQTFKTVLTTDGSKVLKKYFGNDGLAT